MKMSSSLSKILEIGMNVSKSNTRIIKIKNIIKYQLYLYKYINLHLTVAGYNIWISSFKFNWTINDLSEEKKQLREFVWTLRSRVFKHFLLIVALDRSNIRSDQDRFKFDISITPFNFSWTLPFVLNKLAACRVQCNPYLVTITMINWFIQDQVHRSPCFRFN